MKKKKPFVVLTGMSGAGKTEMQKYLTAHYPTQYSKFITSTNRPLRPDEKDGIDYYARGLEFFTDNPTEKLLEHQEVYENGYYGCEYTELNRILLLKQTPVLVADVRGALKFLGKSDAGNIDLSLIDPIVFYIECTIDEAIARIRLDNANGNRSDKEEDIQRRIKRMHMEYDLRTEFDNPILNSGRHQDFAGNELVNQIFKKIKQLPNATRNHRPIQTSSR